MKLLERTEKYETYSETEAKETIEQFRMDAIAKNYKIKKASYEYKTKKAKGEIVGEVWVVTITQVYATLWEDWVNG